MIDELLQKIESVGNPSVIGLDPTYEMIPRKIAEEKIKDHGKTLKAVSEMFFEFNKNIIDHILDIVPAIKPQIAMYEKFGLEGLEAYFKTIEYAKGKGLIVIGDIKRGDIASTAEAYAAHIGGVDIEGQKLDPWKEDWITVNPYFGMDGIAPFIKACVESNKGIFVLVKTSNPTSCQLQDLICGGETIYEKVAALVSEWGLSAPGGKGYSKIGAVVGATHKEQGEKLRRLMPGTFFLVPGYGAQGATGEDLKGFFDKEGRGCIINSSRGITAAYKNDTKYGEHNYGEAAREAALKMRRDLEI